MPVAMVTGASGGLGRECVGRLAADGFDVAALDVDGTAPKALATGEGPPGSGTRSGRVLAVEADLRSAAEIDDAFELVEGRLGPVDVLVNNAAIYPSTPFLDISLAEYDDVVSVNQRAYFLAAQRAASGMCERGHGSIVNVASITWHGGWGDLASYVSTKGAAVSLTRALARELGRHGVRVNAVSPGAFPTAAEEIHPDPARYGSFVLDHQALKRRGRAEELAAVVAFLVGPDSSFVSGQTINVDGGWVMT